MASINPKNFSSSYLYSKEPAYEKKLHEFLLRADRIDKSDTAFEDILYQVKNRQRTSVLLDVLKSGNIILLTNNAPAPRAFKVMFAVDPKDGVAKVFIDCSECIRLDKGKWVTNSIDVLISYLVSAMNTLIYMNKPDRYRMDSDINKVGAKAFASLFTNIVDYLFKISTIESSKYACMYFTSVYFQVCILEKDRDASSVRANALAIAQISDRQADMLDLYTDIHSYDNIKSLIDLLAKALKLPKLTLELFMEKWIYLYHAGTQFAVELFPAFCSMLTDAFVGAYVNNQKTIEKVVGADLVVFTNATFKIGEAEVKK